MVQLYARFGDESVVNTATQNFQGVPKITRLASGGYVIIWSDGSNSGADTSNGGVKGQIYDSNGSKVGLEFQVNTTTSGRQTADSVAATANGGFVAVYLTESNAIRAQRFDSSGTPSGSELLVTAPASDSINRDSSVTALTNGIIIVTWAKHEFVGPNTGQHIYAKAFSGTTGAALSSEFRLDSSTDPAAYQANSSVTALASGGWVATWMDTVGGDSEIRGQVFAANGLKVGAQFNVNTATLGLQMAPAITALAGGGFAIAWTDGLFRTAFDNMLNTGPTADSAIKVQLFNDSGAKVGGEIVVNSANDGLQGVPSIDDLPGGGFVVTWGDRSLSGRDQDGYAVMARVYDSTGAATGAQFLVNTVAAGNQEAPVVAALASGRFVVAWQGAGAEIDTRAQLFAPSVAGPTDIALSSSSVSETSLGNYAVATLSDNGGVNGGSTYTLLADSTGGAFRIDGDRLVVAENAWLDFETAPNASLTVRVTDLNGNSHEEVLSVAITDTVDEHRYRAPSGFAVVGDVRGDESQAAVAALESGGFVMAWMDSGTGGDGSGPAIRAQMFGRTGIPTSIELAVNTATSNAQQAPSVVGLPDGGFVVLWEDSSLTGGDSSETSIKGQLFASSGAKVGGEFLVNSATGGMQHQAAAAPLASGGFVVTWTDHSVPNQFGTGDIRAQIYDAAGNKVGGEILADTAGTYAVQNGSAVAASADGGFVVTWYSGPYIVAQRFDPAGGKLGGEIAVAGPSGFWTQSDPAIATLASGNFLIAWSTGFAVQAQMFGADGAKIGTAFTVDSPAPGAPIAPTISALPWGGFVIGWEDWSQQSGDSAGKAIRAQLFDASGVRMNDEFVVNAGSYGGTYGDQKAPVSAVLKGGDFVMGWVDGYFNQGESRTTVLGRVFLQNGASEGDDVLVGTPGVDLIDGLGGGDRLYGLAGDDDLIGGAGIDRLDGGTGADRMRGGGGSDIYHVDNAGDTVEENADEGLDEVHTSLAAYSLVGTNLERLVATSDNAHDFRGNAGTNVIAGGAGNDVLRLYDGGNDGAYGGGGDDIFFFIGTLNSTDLVDGGAGVDTLVLQGSYGTLFLAGNITRIENISLLSGGNTAFGEPGTNRYDYVLIPGDSNFAAGVQARINAAALLEGEDFTFNGSMESDASYVVYGGKGKDSLVGGLGNDIFFFAEERFASGDTVNGGSGYDGMFLRGNYTIDFNAPGYTGLFTNIENLTLTSATDERYARGGGTEFDYSLTLSDAIVNAGQVLTISGALLLATESMAVDARLESNGSLRLFGGKANDMLLGGGQADLIHGALGGDLVAGNGGADSFRYQDIAESTVWAMDQILDFTPGTDKIELDRIDSNAGVAGDQAFTWIGSNAFTGTAGQLRAYQSGPTWFVEGDTNGDGVADLVIALTLQGATPLSMGDFIL